VRLRTSGGPDVVDAFGEQLRRHRAVRQLSQEELAERARISVRSVGELERGRSPRPETVRQLVEALGLEGSESESFLAAGRAQFRAGRARSGRVAASGVPETPRQLPPDLPDFVGRAEEVASITAALHRPCVSPVVVVVSGPPGVGKTALGIHVAHRAVDSFPDGQVYLTLAADGDADPGHQLDFVLRALGIDGAAVPDALPAKAAMFRSRIADRRVLIVVDNAASHRQVEPLVPPQGSALVVTSRLPLTALPGAVFVDLEPLRRGAAIELLGRVAGPDRVGAEPAASASVVSACAGLPLALRLAGARLAARPQWSVSALAEGLSDEGLRLDELRHGDLAVRAVLELAHDALAPAAARTLALLGALPSPTFPEWVVAGLLDDGRREGRAALDDLLEARLVHPCGPDAAGQPRFRLHDLTRLFARDKAQAELGGPAVAAALARVAAGWLDLARSARDGLPGERLLLDDGDGRPFLAAPAVTAGPAVTAALECPALWFEAERETLSAFVQYCAGNGLAGIAWRLATCCADFFCMRGYRDDWRVTAEAALAAARRADDDDGVIAMLRGVGGCRIELSDWRGAHNVIVEAQERARRAGRPRHAALAQHDLGFLYAMTDRLHEAEAALRAAERGLDRDGLQSRRAVALANLGFVLRERGRPTQAVATLKAAVSVARAHGDGFSRAYAARGLAGALIAIGDLGPAQSYAEEAADSFAGLDDRIGAAQSLRVWGDALGRDPDRLEEAQVILGRAVSLFRENAFDWGVALTELTLGEALARHRDSRAVAYLRRSLAFWDSEGVPALRARALRALRDIDAAAASPPASGRRIDGAAAR
jgi:transcriptional regulator with XRE-family HTH domain/tetratricopeptide (TPR) repeat protein